MSTPRWLTVLNQALSLPENKGPHVFQLASIDTHFTPHVRSLVHWETFASDDKSERPVLLAMTDVRTEKVTQLVSNPNVELAWWISGSLYQFRITGRASLVPAPGHVLHKLSSPPDHIVDWEAKRREGFNSVNAQMRAGWCRPTPGSVISSYEEAENWPSDVKRLNEMGLTEEEERNRQVSFGNFALVLVEPVSVDWLQVGIKPNRRTRFTLNQGGEGWVEEILVP